MLLRAIGERVLADPPWRAAVLEEAQAAWQQQQNGPGEQQEVERALAAVSQKVQRLLDAIENGTAGPDVQDRLDRRLQERLELERRLQGLRRAGEVPSRPPTEEWVEVKLGELHELLGGGGPAAAVGLRALIGSVVLTEIDRPGRKRKHLRGEFTLTSAALARGINAPGNHPAGSRPRTEEVVLDFVEQPPWAAAADQVKELFDAGYGYEEIAARVPCRYSWVAKALTWWHRQRGLPVPDGRNLRKRLRKLTRAGGLADEAKALWDDGLLMQEIAERLGCHRDTVTGAIEHWFRSRGLAVPDGRTRRKSLPREGSPRSNQAEHRGTDRSDAEAG
jgi:hypothetical protein